MGRHIITSQMSKDSQIRKSASDIHKKIKFTAISTDELAKSRMSACPLLIK